MLLPVVLLLVLPLFLRLPKQQVMHDYKYFVYMLNSSSRRALYISITNALTTRVLEHRRAENPKSFTAQYRAFRLVYYEEFADVRAAIAHENQIKGSTRAKKNALVASMNPQTARSFAQEQGSG